MWVSGQKPLWVGFCSVVLRVHGPLPTNCFQEAFPCVLVATRLVWSPNPASPGMCPVRAPSSHGPTLEGGHLAFN